MTETPERWEHGSEFHWLPSRTGRARRLPWDDGLLLGSGRDALRALLAHARDTRGWKRLLVPAFFCQEVVAACMGTGVGLEAYRDHPLETRPGLPRLVAGDAVLHVNYFGLRSGPSFEVPRGVDLVEDHTHDPYSPWAASSSADFCVASLRKTLPIPDGGVLWSPRGHALPSPPPVSVARELASARKLAAMLLKAMYLAGQPIEKAAFRSLAVAGERALTLGEVSSMPAATRALVGAYATNEWRALRAGNHAQLTQALARIPWLQVVAPTGPEAVPFSLFCMVDREDRREQVRARLIERSVYPAILWPLDSTVVDIPNDIRALSRRTLSLHCDGRYGGRDLERVAELMAGSG